MLLGLAITTMRQKNRCTKKIDAPKKRCTKKKMHQKYKLKDFLEASTFFPRYHAINLHN